MKDLYKILRVAKDATSEEIRKAYYKLAKKLHPDKGEGSDAMAFKEVAYAYSILSDDDKRKRYDSGESVDDVDNRQSKLMQSLAELLIKAIQKSDVKYTDILTMMRNEVDAAIAEMEVIMGKGTELIKRLEEANSRFGGEKEMINAIVTHTLANATAQKNKVQGDIDLMKELYDRLKKLTYKVDKRPKNETPTYDHVNDLYRTILNGGR